MTATYPGRFAGKKAVVTGAASGIGEATARRLHAEGAHVVAADIRGDALEDLVSAIGSDGFLGHQVDMMDLGAVEDMVNASADNLGGIDILVNNAGIGSFGTVADIDLAHWREVMTIDLDAVMWASRSALPYLLQSHGCIVNVASVAGIGGDYGFAAYNTAKAGVINLTRAMALDHSPVVRINAVSPGLTRTPLAAGLHGNRDVMDAWQDALPLGRPAETEEVAAAITFLASSDASYINGHNLVVDGGGHAHTGMPHFTRLLGGQSHLDGMATQIKRDAEGHQSP
ncbi:MAG: SDR family oxidoreductase [Novosphingobium sp.]|nr:SDR family oxidoreductase [Novosphingobium sp.]